MSVLVVRHAFAGKRRNWKGDDRLRPLTAYGHRQAEALVTMLEDRPVETVVSSPARRCIETVTPLVAWRGVSLLVVGDLAPGARVEDVQKVLAELEDVPAVLCTHREVLERLFPAARADGAKLKGGMKWPKGSSWDLEIRDGRIVRGQRLPAPRVPEPGRTRNRKKST